MTKVSIGQEWHFPGDPPPLGKARADFFNHIPEVVPDAVADLAGAPLTAYKAAIKDPDFTRWLVKRLSKEDTYRNERLRELSDMVAGWQDRWNLRDDWLGGAALQVLGRWAHHAPPSDGSWEIGGGFMTRDVTSYQPPPIELPTWVPSMLPWSSYKTIANAQVSEALTRFRKDAERQMRAAGARKVRHMRPTGRAGDHTEWLIRFQILGHSYGEIRLRPSLSRKRASLRGARQDAERTVQRAIKELAEHIGLTLRTTDRNLG